MDTATLAILLVLCAALALYGYRLSRGESEDADSEIDAGSAILDFARAFPGEAIRSLHMTSEHEAVFVRLHDNRAGFMRNMGSHYTCLLLDPKSLRVEPLESGDGLRVEFNEFPNFSGDYRFNSHEEAADVALWLLASLQVDAQEGEEEGAKTTDDDAVTPVEDSISRPNEEDPLAAFTSGPEPDAKS